MAVRMFRTQAELAVLAVGVVVALGAARPLSPPPAAGDWALPNESLSSTRAATGSAIDASNVARLKPLWRFKLGARPGFAGVFTANPLAVGDTVYVQDLSSNVFALARRTGRLRWAQRFRSTSRGPNGLAAAGGRLLGNTATSAFALDAATGRRVWVRRLTSRLEQAIDIAPVVANGLVYTSTIGLVPGGKGALYALDAVTGRVVWRFVTIRGAWTDPREAGGGGAWWPMSVDERGRVYAGNSNPLPWGGSKRHPNGGAYRGPALYTDSLLALDGATGKLLWYEQAVPH